MLLGTEYIEPDEYALALVELPMLSPDFKSMRRYRILYVVRNDNLAEYREDMGLASDFNAPPFRILGGVTEGSKVYFEHTVGELLDMADYLRDEGPKFRQRLRDKEAESTMVQDAIDQYEERSQIIANRSSYGPTGHTQRDGFSRRALNAQ